MKTNYSNTKIRVRELPPLVKRLVENKTAIQKHAQGKITQQELNKRGIKFVDPL